jgi:cytochrome c-type biogenesis protein CcmE
MVVAAAAPILALSVGLSLYAMGDTAVYFYSPSQALEKHVPSDGTVLFGVTDRKASDKVVFKGDLPDLFREGQGVVTEGEFQPDGVFEARQVLAKHDERYMPKEVADALKKSGQWRGPATVAAALPAGAEAKEAGAQ